jgi:hypothetical protein
MPWNIRGKIACHYPARGNPNLDVMAIGFVPAGSNQSANDIKNIKAVYFIPAGIDPSTVTVNNLHDYLVWERYWEEPSQRLLAEDTGHYVLMKYSPSSDITVSSIGILTKGTGTNGRCVYVLDENGILIGKSTGNEATVEDTTIHGYTAIKRTTTFDTSIPLKAGKDYWIQYYFENCQNSPDAYYLNETGTEYKNLSLNNYSSATPVDMSTMSFVGKLFDSNSTCADIIATILQLDNGDVFLPNKGTNWPIQGMTANNFYERNSNYINKFAKQVDHDSMSSNKNYPTMSELSDMDEDELIVIGYTENNADRVSVWERTDASIPSSVTNYQINLADDIADWMVAMNVANKTCTFTRGSSDWDYAYATPTTDGSTMYVRTANGSIAFSSHNDEIDTVPDSPVMGRVYLKKRGASFPGTTQWTMGSMMVIYLGNNNWADFNQIDKVYTLSDNTTIQYFTKNTISTFAEDITSSVWADNNPHIFTRLNPQPTLIDITQTQSDYIKHYLEINGNEVT